MSDTFSTAQFNALTDKIHQGLHEAALKMDELPSKVSAALDHWWIPDFVGDAVTWILDKIAGLTHMMLEKLGEALKGVAAPLAYAIDAASWAEISGAMNTVAGGLKPERLVTDQNWKGRACDNYMEAAKQHENAASQIAAIASTIKDGLVFCSVAGFSFYLVVGGVVVKLLLALAAVLLSIQSIFLAPVALASIAEEAGVNSLILAGAGSALVSVLVAQAQPLVNLKGILADKGAFPDGQWPQSGAKGFSDATVTDGTARWSVKE